MNLSASTKYDDKSPETLDCQSDSLADAAAAAILLIGSDVIESFIPKWKVGTDSRLGLDLHGTTNYSTR